MEAYARTNRSESGLPSSPGHNLWNHAHVTNTIHLAPPPIPPMKVPVRPPPLKPVPVSVGNSGGGVPLSPLAMDRLGLPLSLPFSPDLLWRYPLAAMSPAQPPQSPLMDKSQLPGALGPDPRSWAREDVATFLRWCEREFDLPPFDMEKFQMNGKALCLLNKSDITERAPSGGDVIHNALQLLLRDVPYLGRMPNSPLTPHPLTSLTHSHLIQGNHSHGLLSPPGSARTPTSASWPSSTPLFASADLHNLGHIIQQTNSVTLSPAPSGDSSQSTGSPQHGEQASTQGHAHNHGPTMNYSITGNGNHQAGGSAGSTSASGSQSDSEESLQDQSPQRSPVSLNAHIPPLSPGPMQTLKENVTNGRESDTLDSNSNGRLLWDFLQQLLNDPSQRYSLYIAWKNRDTGVFKITDPAGLARLWGIQKNHPSMNYDKMSRALRYYYRVNILRKVQGERHCYQFLRNPVELKSIKNISLLRHQMVSAGNVVSQPAAPKAADYAADSTPLKVGRYSPNGDYAYEAGYEDCDMPTDLSMESCERRITASLERPHPFSPTVKSENIAMAALDRPNSFLSTVKSEKVAS